MASLSLELSIGGQSILDDAIRLNIVAQEIYDRTRPRIYPIFLDSDWADLWDVYANFDELFEDVGSSYPAERATAVSASESTDSPSKSLQDIMDLAHDENVSEWVDAISLTLSSFGGKSTFQALAARMGLSKAELWMGLLEGRFELIGGESFYGRDFLIISRPFE